MWATTFDSSGGLGYQFGPRKTTSVLLPHIQRCLKILIFSSEHYAVSSDQCNLFDVLAGCALTQCALLTPRTQPCSRTQKKTTAIGPWSRFNHVVEGTFLSTSPRPGVRPVLLCLGWVGCLASGLSVEECKFAQQLNRSCPADSAADQEKLN